MSQPAVKHETLSANDADYVKVSELSEVQHVTDERGEPPLPKSTPDSPVKQVMEEFMGIIDEMDDLREMLRAEGIPLRNTRIMVEFGIQNQPENLTMALEGALKQALKVNPESALSRQDLENHISTIVGLERELKQARNIAKEEGLDVQALSILTQMVQQNPSDNGSKAVNTFLAYALEYGVKTDRLAEIAGTQIQRQTSVLPQIPRKADGPKASLRAKMLQDMLTGLIIGVVIISWLL